MTKFVQVVATVEETALAAVAVTGAPGGAGDAVAYTTQSSAATLSNTSRGCDVQYKVGGGAWTDLERGCGIDLAIDFSTTSLYLRRSTLDGGPATCSLSIDGMPVVRVANQTLGGGGASSTESLSGPRTITADDDQKQFTCITALTVTCPNGLSPKPSTIFFPPATGNLTLTPAGGATLNGSASPITRAFTGTNKLGVALIPNPYDVNDYTVSGS